LWCECIGDGGLWPEIWLDWRAIVIVNSKILFASILAADAVEGKGKGGDDGYEDEERVFDR